MDFSHLSTVIYGVVFFWALVALLVGFGLGLLF
jgi:hypothetical protein